jgi:hypothetical protein
MARPLSNRPYLTMAGLAVYLGGFKAKQPGKSARKWVARTGIEKKWRGKGWIVHPDHVDALLSRGWSGGPRNK